MGNRIYKSSTVNSVTTQRKYIVDIVGDLPVILLEINPVDYSIAKGYIYANSQILAQYDGDWRTPIDCRYFYLHDRLGSVRQIIDCTADVVKLYTYNPFGELIEEQGTFDNPFRFTDQWFDDEISQYYLRARMYDPHLSRFTGRDPILGQFEEPLTLHKYLYCNNNFVNLLDLNGASSRSAELGFRQFTFDEYMLLWNNKTDPEEESSAILALWTAMFVGAEEITEYFYTSGGTAIAPLSVASGFLFAGPNMYHITYYRLLQHGMINALWRDMFGYDLGLYDIQDFRAGL